MRTVLWLTKYKLSVMETWTSDKPWLQLDTMCNTLFHMHVHMAFCFFLPFWEGLPRSLLLPPNGHASGFHSGGCVTLNLKTWFTFWFMNYGYIELTAVLHQKSQNVSSLAKKKNKYFKWCDNLKLNFFLSRGWTHKNMAYWVLNKSICCIIAS